MHEDMAAQALTNAVTDLADLGYTMADVMRSVLDVYNRRVLAALAQSGAATTTGEPPF